MNERTREQTARRARGGFTLAETLLTILILLLVSGSIAGGMTFAVRQYRESVQLSQAKVLCSTLTSVIRGELANTAKVRLEAGTAYFDGRAFSEGTGEDDKGQLLLGGTPLLSGTSYTSDKLGAAVEVEWNGASRVSLFTVTLHIRDSAGETLLTSAFDVLPLNDVEIES